MTTIKYLYNEREKSVYNPFSSSNSENRDQNSFSGKQFGAIFQISPTSIIGESRKRKYNDMVCDSPQSDKTSNNDDEEDKDSQGRAEKEDKLAENYSYSLLGGLKRVATDDAALKLIKNHIKGYKYELSQEGSDSGFGQKKKSSTKERKLFIDFVKKISSDNNILKKAVKKLNDKVHENVDKVKNYEQLENAYRKLQEENAILKKGLEMAKYRLQEKCLDTSYYNNSSWSSSGGPGNGGIF